MLGCFASFRNGLAWRLQSLGRAVFCCTSGIEVAFGDGTAASGHFARARWLGPNVVLATVLGVTEGKTTMHLLANSDLYPERTRLPTL
jgi:hypothetical protein